VLVYGDIVLIARFLPWWWVKGGGFFILPHCLIWFYFYSFGLIARCVLETGISFGGNV